ncbi:hypothetical protein [Fibrella forsythiae]|uniref:50S ribosomal protein L23 n=1 Tax=Fibrella forsythiae TaxID=2817061 RepID=A0ABS3JKT4_9BACT|nr:hypothetical protein [Fibrella forsythiae]MBO0950607.1 hypothetical protein [Fibrella forsythiae]
MAHNEAHNTKVNKLKSLPLTIPVKDDGSVLRNIKLNGRKSAEISLEKFLSNALRMVGVKKILGYKTRRKVGKGELYSPDGIFIGMVKIWGPGFQK